MSASGRECRFKLTHYRIFRRSPRDETITNHHAGHSGKRSFRGSDRSRGSAAGIASGRRPGADRFFRDLCGTELAHREQVEKSLLGKALAPVVFHV